MNLTDVFAQIKLALDTVSPVDGIDLRALAYPPDSLTPPMAFPVLPDEIKYDVTYKRGGDRVQVPLVVAVGRHGDRTLVNRIGPYCDGSGNSSIKQRLEAFNYSTSVLSYVRVTRCVFDVLTWGTTDYLAAVFTLDIMGPGVV